ncbi:GNAT family N-acetyltransferase [soil metagenome]
MIRSADGDDADAIRAIYEPIVRHTAISFEIDPPTVESIAQRISDSRAWLVCVRDEEVAGYAYAAPFHPRPAYRWSVEVSVYIAEAHRGTGVATALTAALLGELRAQGSVNAFAGIALPNPASVRLFESFGFERIAVQKSVGFKLGAWHDVGWWQHRLREATVPPPRLS